MRKHLTTNDNLKGRKMLGEYRRECYHNKKPVILIRPMKKYATVTWSCDPLYPTKKHGMNELDALGKIVKPYSLGNAGYGVEHGAVVKVAIDKAPELAEKVFDFLADNVKQIDLGGK